jgi:uncharacterized peroxidase-related enzyme
MPQPDHIMKLSVPDFNDLDEDTKKYLNICQKKLGIQPNVLRAYTFNQNKFRTFSRMYNEIFLGDSGLSVLEREMIAVFVSSVNKYYYCLVAHGQAVRELAGDPELGELLVMNWRSAGLSEKYHSMLRYAEKITMDPRKMSDDDRKMLFDNGFSEADIFDIIDVASFFNYTNRMAIGLDMMPNKGYHSINR